MSLMQKNLVLPSGNVINNRIGKSAMTERMADPGNIVSQRHLNLYERWADGGCGLLISGNIMVDRFNLEGAGNIIINHRNFGLQAERLKHLTKIATKSKRLWHIKSKHKSMQ